MTQGYYFWNENIVYYKEIYYIHKLQEKENNEITSKDAKKGLNII